MAVFYGTLGGMVMGAVALASIADSASGSWFFVGAVFGAFVGGFIGTAVEEFINYQKIPRWKKKCRKTTLDAFPSLTERRVRQRGDRLQSVQWYLVENDIEVTPQHGANVDAGLIVKDGAEVSGDTGHIPVFHLPE